MKNIIIPFLLILSFTNAFCQTIESLNLDFEKNKDGYPEGWNSIGTEDYKVYADSLTVQHGKYSLVIESSGTKPNYEAIGIALPNNYDGKFITLSGYIKTENVIEGSMLFVRIDPEIAFEYMSETGVTGSTEWKKYEMTIPLHPKKTKKIVVGGMLLGKGKMWLDNVKILIDGKDLDNKDLIIFKKEEVFSDNDKEFDNGSNIILKNINSQKVSDLELLGRIWGFIKYHHPEIAKGNYNWDYELFRIIPSYLNVKNNIERDEILLSWIEKYGKIPTCKNCKSIPVDAVLKPNLSWLDYSDISHNLKSILRNIYENRNQEKNYYVSLHESGNPDFINENSYSNMSYPDDGYRLLSLYRYWNIIEYFFPYKHLTDKEWSLVLKEYIPKFINSNNKLEYELSALQMIGEANDTHSNLWEIGSEVSKLRGNNYAPFKAQFIENQFVVTDYFNPELSKNAKLKIGDIISHIDGKSVQHIVDSLKIYYPASNQASMLRDISIDLLRSNRNNLDLKYITEKKEKEENIILYDNEKLKKYHWYKINEDSKSYKILDNNIGYIDLSVTQEDDIDKLKKHLKQTKGIIIDLRKYPSVFVPYTLGAYFVSKPTSFAKYTQGNPKNPGEFTFKELDKIKSDENLYKGKLVILVNENTQSAAEYAALALNSVEGSIIIGSTTAGTDGNVSEIVLPGNLKTLISGVGIYYSDGRETQRIGIVPDIVVKPTIEGIKSGKDEILEKAIQYLNN